MSAPSVISRSCWKPRAVPCDRQRLISTSVSAGCESSSIMKVRDARSSTASSRERSPILLPRAAGLPVLPACIVACLAGRRRRRRPAAIAGAGDAVVPCMRVIRWTMMRAARTSLATGVASGAIVPCAACAGLQPWDDVGGDGCPHVALDLAQSSTLGMTCQRHRYPRRAGAPRAADAMDVVSGLPRQIEVDDVADARDIEAASGNVGRNQRADASAAHIRKGSGALELIHIAV